MYLQMRYMDHLVSKVKDLLRNAILELERLQLRSADETKKLPPVVVHSEKIMRQKKDLESFLMHNVYRHPNVIVVRDSAQQALHKLFEALKSKPHLLPENYRLRSKEIGLHRTIGDYIAGMTDRFAWREHARLADD